MWSVLIADDELIECQALELMLRNNYKDVKVLPYAKDGLACIHMAEQYQPDILLVDINMPEFNGIEAVSYLKKKNFQGEIIIITAYSKFAYIQEALRSGVEDYILKPVKVEELCRAINQIRNKNIQKEEKQNVQITEIKKMLQEQILNSLYHANCRSSDFELLRSLEKKNFCGMFLIVGTLDDSVFWQKEKTEVLQERVGRYASCFCGILNHKIMTVVLVDDSVNMTEDRKFIDFFTNILKTILKKEFDISVEVTASRLEKTTEELNKAYRECIFNAGKQEENPENFSKMETIHDPFLEIIEECKECIRKKDKEECQKLIRHMIMKKQFTIIDSEEIKIFSFHFLYTLSKNVYSGEEYFKTYILQNMIEWKAEEKQNLETYLMNGIEQIFSLGEVQENNAYVIKAILYMEREFKRDLALADLAQEAGISQFYLSRLFKQEFDMNFTEILTMIRLGKAIDMIENSVFPVKTIAEESGFLSTSYFYRLIKKKFDISVSRMRELCVEAL